MQGHRSEAGNTTAMTGFELSGAENLDTPRGLDACIAHLCSAGMSDFPTRDAAFGAKRPPPWKSMRGLDQVLAWS